MGAPVGEDTLLRDKKAEWGKTMKRREGRTQPREQPPWVRPMCSSCSLPHRSSLSP